MTFPQQPKIFWLWLFTLTATPIALWTIGDEAFPAMATLGVLTHAAATLTVLASAWAVRQLFKTMLLVTVCAWFAEYLGSTTGYPFGDYHYTDVLQPQLNGVPVIIPFAWLMMLPTAWAVTQAILQKTNFAENRFIFAALSGLAFTAWDLYLDPQMVARNLWVWEQDGAYFGIPLINFFGWWLVSMLITFTIQPNKLPVFPLLWIYTLTWAFQFIGLGIFWNQTGPAVCGFVAMGIFVGGAWKSSWQPQAHFSWARFRSRS